jgi:uncharacterized protein (UPF0332 family)
MKSLEYAESVKALQKADEALKNAEYNLIGGYISTTANRAYYACYYSVIAALYTQKVYAKTHQGARAKFAELFIKTSVFPIEVSDSIAMLFDYRQEADYDLDEDITQEEAAILISKSEDVFKLVREYVLKLIDSEIIK